MMLIDTHCHLDAVEFDADRDVVANHARTQGVAGIVVPSVYQTNFEAVFNLAQKHAHVHYALGIHPMYVNQSQTQDITALKVLLEQAMTFNKPPVAIGEIGLDFFVTTENRDQQIYFFTEQLKLAQAFDLPVILHVRRAVDDVLKYCRKIKVKGGIAHAFNGSRQQADEFIKLGFKLGFGGAMTYPRALKIRALAQTLPMEAIVLETDAPDIPPIWLTQTTQNPMEIKARNSPNELIKIAQVLADLRSLNLTQVTDITTKNALEILPKILPNYGDLCTPLHVLL